MRARPAVAELVLQFNDTDQQELIKRSITIKKTIHLNGLFLSTSFDIYTFSATALSVGADSALPSGLSFAKSTKIGAATKIEE